MEKIKSKTRWAALCLLCMCALPAQNVWAQASADEQIRAATDPLLEGISMEVPEEYAEYSAVGLAAVTTEDYESDRMRRKRTTHFRLLVKIGDRAGRDRYSTISLKDQAQKKAWRDDEKLYSVSIVKPSGEVLHLDLDSLQLNADSLVALPYLEVGDILDYGFREVETTYDGYCFSPRLATLSHEFPVVYVLHRFRVGRGYYINFLGMNDAPSPVKNEALSNKQWQVFDTEIHHLKGESGERWAPTYRTEAAEKMQICHYQARKDKLAPMILGTPNEINTSTTDEEKQRLLKAHYLDLVKNVKNAYTIHFNRWMRQNFWRQELTAEEHLMYSYYHYRYYVLIFDPVTETYRSQHLYRYITPDNFVRIMAHAANMKKIPYEVVFTTSKYLCDFDDAMLAPEFSILFRFQNEAGEWVYLETPTSFQTMDYVGDEFRGQDALAMNRRGKFTRITIPENRAEDNAYVQTVDIRPNFSTHSAELESVSSMTGMVKYDYSTLALRSTDFHHDALKSMLPEGKEDVALKLYQDHREEKTPDELAYDIEEKLTHMKWFRSQNLDLVEYSSYDLLNSGVGGAKDSLKFGETFTVANLVEKVGSRYIINLSKIAADQISLTEAEKESRRNDVFMNYPRTYRTTYRMEIPEGYRARVPDDFGHRVDNRYGSLTMDAVVEDGRALITLTKTYKTSFVPREDWNLMLEFLEPAERLNHACIVLDKIES